MSFSQRQRRTAALAFGVGTALIGGMLVPTAAMAAPDGSGVIINEAYVNGSKGALYKNRFVELYNPGTAAESLQGWSLQYRSATGTGQTQVQNLSGDIAPGGYFLVSLPGSADGLADLPVQPDLTGTSFGPAGASGTIVLADTTQNLTPAVGSVIGTANVVDLLGYGTSNTFEGAAAATPAQPNSLVRTNFVDTDNNAADFTVSTAVTPQNSGGATTPTPTPTPTPTASPTPTPTPEPTTPPTEPSTVTIDAIQGTGATSPLVGQTVTTRGVVTAAYPTGGLNGFYIQTPGTGGTLDASHTASDAVFVYGGSGATGAAVAGLVKVGEYVEVTGPVAEFRTMTQLTPAATGITVLTEQAAPVTPVPAAWPTTDEAREVLEGMLVAPEGDFTVTNTYDTNYYASVGLAAGTTPLENPTDVARPGTPEYDTVVADNAARAVTLDDGASINFNSTANKGIPLPYLSTTSPVRVGAPVTFAAPVIAEYRNDMWNFQPTQHLTVDNAATVQPATFANTREPAPKDVGGDLQIASFNVLNYFTTTAQDWVAAGGSCTYYTDREGNRVTANNCGAGPRGAAEDDDLARQQAKIVAAINGLGAEVVSLEEIENSTIAGENRDEAVKTLVAALNAALGSDEWAYAPSPAAVPAGEDVIRTAFIYKKAAVEPLGASVILDNAAFDNARPPLAQAFTPTGGSDDDAFIAIVNHFKSKGDSEPPATGDNANGVQGAFNGDRTRQAQALVAFADGLKASVGTDDVFLLGDFNSYTQEDPMQVLYEAGYANLAPTDEYTYSFGGQVGSLDHILASTEAQKLVTGSDVWNINSVESIALEYSRYNYNATNFYDDSPFRSSDHDPLVVGLDLDPTVELNLLNINDFHGRIDGTTLKFAGTIEQLRAQYGEDNTLFLSDGDNIGASLYASAFQGDKPTLDVLNALGLQASAVGNHEFDQGLADLKGRVSDVAAFPYLGANVYEKGTTTPVLDEYTIIEVDGLKVGVIGAVTEETPTLVSPGGIADVTFGDPVEAVNRVAAQLTDGDPANGEADVIVAEYHEGAAAGEVEKATLEDEIADGKAFADIATKTSPAVDAIFTGHTHKLYSWNVPIPGTDKTRPIVQTGNYGENIGQVVLTVDAETGDVQSYTAKNVARVAIVDDKNSANDAQQNADLDAQLVAKYPRVAAVKTIVDKAIAEAKVVGSVKVGDVSADITTAFTGGTYVNGVYTGGTRDNRAKQSALGNLVADSLVATLSEERLGGAEIGVVNPGGLRAELLKDADGITVADANAVLPFANNLFTTSLTGAQFKSLLEEQWQTNADGTIPSRSYLALGLSENVQYTFDESAARGSHITGIWIDGEPIDPAQQYRVGSFSFLVQGGDNFRTFTQGTNTRDSGLIDRDAWISYIKAAGTLTPNFASRSAQVTGVPASAAEGDTVTFQVSGLDLTSVGSPATTTLLASFAGSTTVFDPIAVSGGSATVTLKVPADAAASSTIVLQAPQSGTEVRVPIAVTSVEEPPTGEPGTGTPTPTTPPLPETGGGSTPPTTTPQPVSVSELIEALKNVIQVTIGNLVAGGEITIYVGTKYAGAWVSIWLYSTPQQLGGWQQVSAAGTVTVTLPDGVSGSHRLVVLDAAGDVIGWQPVTIAARSGALPATGGDYGWVGGAALLGALLIGFGIIARTTGRRRHS
ncbi:ExeM/NucH family extracellular endonuclease [Microbacterium sp. cx-55]|uniref:ExeM/NucH family extracellular endonuclease n=1 Tax=Microbacterium sp. cx-55 TaxID=2875948 RepID=UPI001CBD3B23|nr:ExeM/NucH family extracellular endonuclease [Microbacterium sp. cx-55]MBZ4487938.1 ExeM/NucH family extracellular endonuclease [Microbacterium sp. cx-55]UGB34652.1 ExeM/NucH family extracellular endonuclease [Microbacterium sp. cx-55]